MNGNKNLKYVFYKFITLTLFAVALKFIQNLYTNLAGGLIHGFCVGVMMVAFQKVMIDTIPNEVTQ